MKRIGYLYEEIISVDNCRKAILNAAKNIKKKKHRKNVQEVINNVDYYAVKLSESLSNLEFCTGYKKKVINDGATGKERVLHIPAFFPDRCAHHAIIQVLRPTIEKSSYYWSCANIPGRGTDRAHRGVERATRKDIKNAKYCIEMDEKKFYHAIPHDKLKHRLRFKYKDEKLLKMLYCLIDSYVEKEIVFDDIVRGLPIGNYTSPWLAELYMQPFDHYVKQELKAIHYVRYADNIVMTGPNKRKLRKSMLLAIDFIETELGMWVKNDYQLFKVSSKKRSGRKIDFVGKCFAIEETTVRKGRALTFMKQSRKIQKLQENGQPISHHEAASFISRSSCLKHTDSAGLKARYYDVIDIEQLKEVIRNESKR